MITTARGNQGSIIQTGNAQLMNSGHAGSPTAPSSPTRIICSWIQHWTFGCLQHLSSCPCTPPLLRHQVCKVPHQLYIIFHVIFKNFKRKKILCFYLYLLVTSPTLLSVDHLRICPGFSPSLCSFRLLSLMAIHFSILSGSLMGQ